MKKMENEVKEDDSILLGCQDKIWNIVIDAFVNDKQPPNKLIIELMNVAIGICAMSEDPRDLLSSLIKDLENFEASPELERLQQKMLKDFEKYQE